MIKKSLMALLPFITIASLGLNANAKTFKIAVGDGGGSVQEAMGISFIKELNRLTDGKHSGKLYLNGALGSEQDTVNDVAAGSLDFSILAINNVTPFSPKVGVLTLPYIMLSLEDAEVITQGPIGDKLVKDTIRDAGARIIGWTYSGFRVLTNSKREVKNVKDLDGLVIRTPKNKIMIETYKSWGINPTPMSWNETFPALQQKVIDGQDTPYITVYSMKFDEVQKYVTNIRYLFLIEPLIMSESLYQSLPEADKKAILQAGRTATYESSKYLRTNEARIKKVLTSRGMKITDAANNEEEFISLATKAVWPQFYKSVGGKAEVNKVLKAIGREPVK